MNSPLKGQVVVVVGASSGIGEGIARAFETEFVTLVLAARRLGKLEDILTNLKQGPESGLNTMSEAVELDVTDADKVKEFYGGLKQRHGHVDVIINCAGCMYFTLLKNEHWKEWDMQVDVNCKGTMYSCGAALPYMLQQKHGHIINISSDAARQTFPALTVYNASKAFVHEYTKGLRCECVGTGVRVTELQPGDVRTGLVLQNSDKEAAEKVGVKIGEKIGGELFDEKNRGSYLDVEDISQAVMYALKAPRHVGIHEILIEPRDQMFGDPTSMAVA